MACAFTWKPYIASVKNATSEKDRKNSIPYLTTNDRDKDHPISFISSIQTKYENVYIFEKRSKRLLLRDQNSSFSGIV